MDELCKHADIWNVELALVEDYVVEELGFVRVRKIQTVRQVVVKNVCAFCSLTHDELLKELEELELGFLE